MGYYIDLETIDIDDYKNKLRSGYLPPSRMILKENLDERFTYFKQIGIKNVKQLIQTLKKKDNLEDLIKQECFSEEYLKILLRELNSILPKPNKLSDFSKVSKEVIDKLETKGIKNTQKLFDFVITPENRKQLSESLDIDNTDILILTKLTDLSRIKWVGATFAQMLFDLGIDTVEKAAKANADELHLRINQLNKDKGIYKGQIGLNDIRIFVDAANEVPLDIKYE